MTIPAAVSRRTAVATLAAAGLGAACRASSVSQPTGPSIDELAERYVRLTLELAQHQPSLVEQWLGPDHWRPGARRPVSRLRAEIDDLQVALSRQPAADAERETYLTGQIDALLVAARRLSGETMGFLDEARASLGADVAAIVSDGHDQLGRREVEAARGELERRLPGDGTLLERYKAHRTRHAIPVDRLAALFQAATENCRERVRKRLELPASEHVQLESAAEMGLEGRAQYDGQFRSRVSIARGTIDLARLVWLVAHESYPGHHLQHVLGDRDIVAARGWSERLLVPSFGRHLLYAEGAADAGAALLLEGGTFEEVCGALSPTAGVRPGDIDNLVGVHRAVTALDLEIITVARDYLDGKLNTDGAATALHEQALVVDALRMLQIIERQRTRMLAYPCGRRLVTARLDAEAAASRWSRFAAIATTLTIG